jgi:Asp-tRNA(Asn)/Glu-tRNA(Gln) amidotransferase A subunit family amidase
MGQQSSLRLALERSKPDTANFIIHIVGNLFMDISKPDSTDSDSPPAVRHPLALSRRALLGTLGALGIGSPVFQRALAAQVQKAKQITPEMIKQAEWIAGIELPEDARQSTAQAVGRLVRDFEALRGVKLDNRVAPALIFQPAPWHVPSGPPDRGSVRLSKEAVAKKPDSAEMLAFAPVAELAGLLRTRQVTSVELTKLYLDRLKKFDPVLHCVVNLTEELALKSAEKADREIAAGRYRGPLHGVPWGAKDLIAYPGYKTTWGAKPYKDQTIDLKATVAQRLEDAGAVLIAKLALGALAMGDQWFGGLCRSPWNPTRGSSGSSAGSASATAAGCVGFSLGSETQGSIISPSRVCGNTSLRPTFGRVSRHGCMALSWSMDKIGPLCRSVEDCALVLGAIHGTDGQDATAVDRPLFWPCLRDLRSMRVGYFEARKDAPEMAVLKDLGVQLVPIKLPTKYPVDALGVILSAEAATSFDDLTRLGVTDGLNTWPRTFRSGQFIPAVEYIRANRIRSLVMQEMESVMAQVDLYVGGNDLQLTNMTGHPTLIMPNGFVKNDEIETPRSITFTGRLFGETELLAVGHAYQQATGHHLKHPPMERWLTKPRAVEVKEKKETKP